MCLIEVLIYEARMTKRGLISNLLPEWCKCIQTMQFITEATIEADSSIHGMNIGLVTTICA